MQQQAMPNIRDDSNGSSNDYDTTNVPRTKEGSEFGRYVFEHQGRKIYEWDQNLDEVNVYIDTPANNRARDFSVKIQSNRLRIGLKSNDRFFIDENTFSKVKTSDSSWYLDPDTSVIHVILAKVHRGETWEGALTGRDGDSSSNNGSSGIVDPLTRETIKKELMLERFQEENAGFDFRGATFNGEAPDPRTFMGGVKRC